jgi:HK97 family phage portal protein
MPDRVTVEREEDGQIVYEHRGETETTELAAANVLHIHGLGFDGLVGYSPIRQAARSIGTGMAQDTFGQSFYANGAPISMLIELPGSMTKEQIEDAEKYHNDKHSGPDKAFRVKVAPKDTKVHQMSMPLVDAQFMASREFGVTEICRWYGVPPHKVADLTRSTNNNIEHQGIEFVQDAIVPWAVRLEQEANIKLFGARAQGRVYTKLMINGLQRGDSKARAEWYRTMTQIGAMSINEVRELEELNSIPDGDKHLVQLNQTTLERLVEEPPEPKTTNEPAADATEPDDGQPTNVIRAAALEWRRNEQR